MENLVGICKYCGAQMGVLAQNQTEADRMAEEKCTCGGAKKARKKESVLKEINNIIGPGCAEGFSPVEEAVHAAIETIGLMIVDKQLQQASFKVDGTVVTIKSGLSGIKVSRKRTYEQTGEVEE